MPMATLLHDFRFAIRLLRRIPGFVFTVVITLGIGLGLNTALFTLFNAYVLRPIAVRDPTASISSVQRLRASGRGATYSVGITPGSSIRRSEGCRCSRKFWQLAGSMRA